MNNDQKSYREGKTTIVTQISLENMRNELVKDKQVPIFELDPTVKSKLNKSKIQNEMLTDHIKESHKEFIKKHQELHTNPKTHKKLTEKRGKEITDQFEDEFKEEIKKEQEENKSLFDEMEYEDEYDVFLGDIGYSKNNIAKIKLLCGQLCPFHSEIELLHP